MGSYVVYDKSKITVSAYVNNANNLGVALMHYFTRRKDAKLR